MVSPELLWRLKRLMEPMDMDQSKYAREPVVIKRVLKKRNVVMFALLVSAALLVFLLAAIAYEKYQHDIVLWWRCLNTSTEERFLVYSEVLDEEPGYFYRKQKACKRIGEMGDSVIPLVVKELFGEHSSFEKKRAMLCLIRELDPRIYCNLVAGVPYCEKELDSELLKKTLNITWLTKAEIPTEQRRRVLERIKSWGESFESQYQEYEEFCRNRE